MSVIKSESLHVFVLNTVNPNHEPAVYMDAELYSEPPKYDSSDHTPGDRALRVLDRSGAL